jgi:hypothetical protein
MLRRALPIVPAQGGYAPRNVPRDFLGNDGMAKAQAEKQNTEPYIPKIQLSPHVAASWNHPGVAK